MPCDICGICKYSYSVEDEFRNGEKVFTVFCTKRNNVSGTPLPLNRHIECSFFEPKRGKSAAVKRTLREGR